MSEDNKVVTLASARRSQVFAVRVTVMRDRNATPLPGHTNLGEFVSDMDADDAALAACLREAADVTDPTLWVPTEYEGVFASVDNIPEEAEEANDN